MVYNFDMCWKCGKENKVALPLSRSAECEFCGADLHSCKNCSFYSPGSHYDCHETIDELITDKERANFCDYFKFSTVSSGKTFGTNAAEDAKKAFNSLFGD